jgi:hypothetical protein
MKGLNRYTPFIDNEQISSPELKDEGNISGRHSCVELLLYKADVNKFNGRATALYTQFIQKLVE